MSMLAGSCVAAAARGARVRRGGFAERARPHRPADRHGVRFRGPRAGRARARGRPGSALVRASPRTTSRGGSACPPRAVSDDVAMARSPRRSPLMTWSGPVPGGVTPGLRGGTRCRAHHVAVARTLSVLPLTVGYIGGYVESAPAAADESDSDETAAKREGCGAGGERRRICVWAHHAGASRARGGAGAGVRAESGDGLPIAVSVLAVVMGSTCWRWSWSSSSRPLRRELGKDIPPRSKRTPSAWRSRSPRRRARRPCCHAAGLRRQQRRPGDGRRAAVHVHQRVRASLPSRGRRRGA